MILIGIDPGVHTGVAVYNKPEKVLIDLQTVCIVNAFKIVWGYHTESDIKLYFEDARMRTWFGKKNQAQLQGAGSIKRDCHIWNEFCVVNDIPFEAVHPKNNITKVDRYSFKRMTGWEGRSNEHSRDAAMLVFGK